MLETTIFIDTTKMHWWQFLSHTQLMELNNVTFGRSVFQVLPLISGVIGSCRITLKSRIKDDVDLLRETLGELMIRTKGNQRPDNPREGDLICIIQLNSAVVVEVDAHEDFPWRISVDAYILEWGDAYKEKYKYFLEEQHEQTTS